MYDSPFYRDHAVAMHKLFTELVLHPSVLPMFYEADLMGTPGQFGPLLHSPLFPDVLGRMHSPDGRLLLLVPEGPSPFRMVITETDQYIAQGVCHLYYEHPAGKGSVCGGSVTAAKEVAAALKLAAATLGLGVAPA